MNRSRTLFALITLALSPSALAIKNIACQTQAPFNAPHDMQVSIRAEGRIFNQGSVVVMRDFRSVYLITYAGKEVWARDATGIVRETRNNRAYRPIKYRNSVQFDLRLLFQNGSDVQLILPKDAATRVRPFAGVAIMTAIQDHFGASVPVVCKNR